MQDIYYAVNTMPPFHKKWIIYKIYVTTILLWYDDFAKYILKEVQFAKALILSQHYSQTQ